MTDFEVEVLQHVGTIEALLLFFAVALLFWGAYKFLRMFF